MCAQEKRQRGEKGDKEESAVMEEVGGKIREGCEEEKADGGGGTKVERERGRERKRRTERK